MALQLRPNCEGCDRDLPPQASDAMICTYECTFCDACVAAIRNVCPNCGGGFERRPVRPRTAWRPGVSLTHDPASSVRVHTPFSPQEIAEFAERVCALPPDER